MDFSDIIPIISGAVGGAATTGVFKGPLQTLDDWWYINFGHKTSEKADMLRAKKEADLENYKELIIKELTPISPTNVQSPQLSILGPALEASSYYIGDEELRKMFAKLIGATFDKTKNSIAHVSFVEIIKQLSPHDARLLKTFKSNKFYPAIAVVSILNYLNNGEHSFKIIKDIVFVSEENIDINLNEFSISNLIRLGILSNNLNETFPNTLTPIAYEIYEKNFLSDNSSIKLKQGMLQVTPFGQNLLRTCL